MKILVYIIFLLLFTSACNNNGVTGKLNEIDSLVAHEQYDSAERVFAKIDTFLLIDADTKAHYHLLRTQLACVLGKHDSLNMLDSIIIPYYREIDNKEKLAEAFYYKGYTELCNGNVPEAITCYKRAEELANYTPNLRLQYKIAESLAYINGICKKSILCIQYGQNDLY